MSSLCSLSASSDPYFSAPIPLMVVKDYDSPAPGTLKVQAGDSLTQTGFQGNWIMAHNSTGQAGWVPSFHVVPIQIKPPPQATAATTTPATPAPTTPVTPATPVTPETTATPAAPVSPRNEPN